MSERDPDTLTDWRHSLLIHFDRVLADYEWRAAAQAAQEIPHAKSMVAYATPTEEGLHDLLTRAEVAMEGAALALGFDYDTMPEASRKEAIRLARESLEPLINELRSVRNVNDKFEESDRSVYKRTLQYIMQVLGPNAVCECSGCNVETTEALDAIRKVGIEYQARGPKRTTHEPEKERRGNALSALDEDPSILATMRDVFAGEAMQAFIMKNDQAENNENICAEWAYQQADAMLRARRKKPVE